MGALKGRMSPLSFQVQGKIERWDQVMRNITRLRFQELDPSSGNQQAIGWVSLTDPFSTELDRHAISFGESIIGLAMRIDAISIPASQVKLHLSRCIKAVLKETGQKRLSKRDLAALKDEVVAELSRKTFPLIKIYEMVFDTEAGRLWFFGKSKKVVETFFDLFSETFGLGLLPESPYTVAARLLGEERANDLLDLPPADFSTGQVY